MTGNTMTRKSEVLDVPELSPEELEAVSGGWVHRFRPLQSNGRRCCRCGQVGVEQTHLTTDQINYRHETPKCCIWS